MQLYYECLATTTLGETMDVLPSADLSRGMPPEEFFECLISDRYKVEAWRESPAALDLTIPSSNWCALTCLRMALKLERISTPTLTELFEQACAAGVYAWRQDGRGWAGAYHEPLACFIRRFGFLVTQAQEAGPETVAQALCDGYYAFLSVSPDIRYPTREKPAKTNGHLVFAYAYHTSQEGRVFHIQNAAGFASLGSQIGFPVPEARLRQVFSGRAMFLRRQ